jgi:hypothetical protein
MSDILKMDMINSLPHPFYGSENGKDWWWPIVDICVQTGVCRIDVCGRLEVKHILDFRTIRDAGQVPHEPESFYLDYEAEQ